MASKLKYRPASDGLETEAPPLPMCAARSRGRDDWRLAPERPGSAGRAETVGARIQNRGMAEIGTQTHHALDYIELGVTDFAAAKAFYGDAFGWAFTDYGPGPAYVGIRRSGDADMEVGGFRLEEQIQPGGPLVLLYSADLDASADAVRSAGGAITSGPYDFPGGRRFHFSDPSGNDLGVWSAR